MSPGFDAAVIESAPSEASVSLCPGRREWMIDSTRPALVAGRWTENCDACSPAVLGALALPMPTHLVAHYVVSPSELQCPSCQSEGLGSLMVLIGSRCKAEA